MEKAKKVSKVIFFSHFEEPHNVFPVKSSLNGNHMRKEYLLSVKCLRTKLFNRLMYLLCCIPEAWGGGGGQLT